MTRIERAVRKLTSRYFEQAGDQVVMYNVIADCNSGEFDNFTPAQIREICLEAISRLEGENALEMAREYIAEQCDNFEVVFDFGNGEQIYIGA